MIPCAAGALEGPRPYDEVSCETFNPLGPCPVAAEEVGDPQHLGLHLSANGDMVSRSTTWCRT